MFFFFKQKTAYEVRISDWSSDVCSSDLLLAHFRALAEASDLPMVVYNVPARTVTDIGAETMCKLAEIPSVVAVKDASGDLARVTIHRAGAGHDFCQLSGNDDLWLPHARSEERRVGKECVSTCRSRWTRYR